MGLLGKGDSANAYNAETYVKADVRLRVLRMLYSPSHVFCHVYRSRILSRSALFRGSW